MDVVLSAQAHADAQRVAGGGCGGGGEGRSSRRCCEVEKRREDEVKARDVHLSTSDYLRGKVRPSDPGIQGLANPEKGMAKVDEHY